MKNIAAHYEIPFFDFESVMLLEEEFDVEIPDNIAEELTTFDSIVDYISKNAS